MTATTRRQSTTAQVREHFRAMKESTAPQAARALGIDQTLVRRAIATLKKQGWLTCTRIVGIYRFREVPEHERGQTHRLQEKMWRAMRMSRTWTTWDVAQLAGATLDYVKKYAAQLAAEGLIVQAGTTGHRKIWRVADGAPQETPPFRSRAAVKEQAMQSAIDAGWALMRALLAGDRSQALEDLAELNIRIRGMGEGKQ